MTFTPTPEQLAIIDRIISRTSPTTIVSAGPGCAKTTTIIEAMNLLAPHTSSQWVPGRCSLVYTAFNKETVNSAANRLVEANINTNGVYRVNCATLNSLGFAMWNRSREGTRTELRATKMREILREIQDAGRYSISPEEWPDLTALVSFAKSQGYLPSTSGSAYRSLIDFKQLCIIADVLPQPHYQIILDIALKLSIQKAFNNVFDFDDQLYMSALFSPVSRGPEFLFVDEAQDLSPIQLFLITRLRAEFTVFVGDPNQAIYGFRGAMTDSFARIRAKYPDATNLPLLTSFRIPQAILPILRQTNPGLATLSKTLGSARTWETSTTITDFLTSLSGTKAIICRNNAPLYRVALACISAKLPFRLSDTSFGERLLKDVARAIPDPQNAPVSATFLSLMSNFWVSRAGENDKALSLAFDKLAALENLIDITQPSTIAALLLTIKSLLTKSSDKGLFLSTAHKAKGLEFDSVVHLDPQLIPNKWAVTSDQIAQEHNIAYVINSRPKNLLVFLDSANLTIPGTPTRTVTNPAKKVKA